MKAIVCRGAQLLHLFNIEKLETPKLFKVHRLSLLLPGVKAVLNGVWPTWETDTPGISNFEDFSKLVRGIEEIDPESYNFRYPTDTNGQAALNHHTVINVVGFSQHMDPILELLDGAVIGLHEEFNAAAEAKFELQSIIERISEQSDSADR